uniref:Retrovirus-related Pol polyprotein from transposon TNT 1-94-like beta-barrel domain-containing protein n=1 Tax=Cajanus cajan TaxID=3821 RepID=A0A151T024_CAJCA|nr:hypothetical protein KK1_022815 [Cajanus cajan]
MLASSLHAQVDDMWYPDSGASNHLTNDISNLITKQEYQGKQHALVGDGNSLLISHIGHSKMHNVKPNIIFSLPNIMYVPNISKNLLSISKFTNYNKVFVEFHPNKCIVKSQETKMVLLKWHLKDGLYVFDDLRPVHTHTEFVKPSALSLLSIILYLVMMCQSGTLG